MGRLMKPITRWIVVGLAAALLVTANPFASWGAPSDSPHGSLVGPGPNFKQDTDVCVLCHWTHAAPGQGSALERKDEVLLCYTCHGSDGAGSTYTVQNDFNKASVHRLWPAVSVFGPNPKACSACHNVHGDKDASGALYPRLLRSRDVTSTLYYQGDAYYSGDAFCGACHAAPWTPPAQAVDTTLYESTPHFTSLSDPPSGTLIRCEACHDHHGSNVAPLLNEITHGETVTGNDKSECYACHAVRLGTYAGTAAYDGSTHGSAGGVMAGKPVSACQQCHDPHGRADAGGLFPSLTSALEESVCYRCHGPAGPAAVDLKSPVPSAAAGARVEVLAGVAPADHAGGQARLAVLSQDTSGPTPRPLRGPYEVAAPDAMNAVAVGDIDGDGAAEAVMAVGGSLDVVRQSTPSRLVLASSLDIASPAADLAFGDFDRDGQQELAVVSPDAGSLSICRWIGGALAQSASYASGGSRPTAVAAGDVDGDGRVDLVVANTGSDNFAFFRQDGFGSLGAPEIVSTDSSPTGVAIADIDGDGDKEIVVACSGSDTVRNYSYAAGAFSGIGSYDTSCPPGAHPRGVVAADFLEGYSGAEVAVSVYSDATESAVDVFRAGSGGALTLVQQLSTGALSRTWDLAGADVDGDGKLELLASDAGTFLARAPRVEVFGAAGQYSMGTPTPVEVGAAEDGGSRMRLAIGDVGSLYPYRHDVAAASRAHESSETAISLANRHVECTDCHNAHVEDTATAQAPNVPGPLRGTAGMEPLNGPAGSTPSMSPTSSAAYEFAICFKCHSGSAGQTGPRDVAVAFNSGNASFHPVEAAGAGQGIANGAWVGSWRSDSRVYCGDCHGTYGSGLAAGPHFSAAPSILRGPYAGAASDPDMVCYRCHRYEAYYEGDESPSSPASRFYDGRYGVPQLHSFHLKDKRFDCRACHVSHGSATKPHLLRADIGYTHDDAGGANGGGSCSATGCHAATHYYRALYP
jgi:predicted CXXCH cytochrome family protein